MIDLKAIAKDAAERVHQNGGCVPQMAFAPILFALQDALPTTPARAEAQDEGAAWYWVKGSRPLCGEEVFSRDKVIIDRWADDPAVEIIPLYAHPSPTPAADTDRVLEEAVGHMSWMRKFVPCVFDVTEERLKEIDDFIHAHEPALKSTAAKEGGAL